MPRNATTTQIYHFIFPVHSKQSNVPSSPCPSSTFTLTKHACVFFTLSIIWHRDYNPTVAIHLNKKIEICPLSVLPMYVCTDIRLQPLICAIPAIVYDEKYFYCMALFGEGYNIRIGNSIFIRMDIPRLSHCAFGWIILRVCGRDQTMAKGRLFL